MQIKNIQGLTFGEISEEVNNGGKFVFYYYTISILIMTFRRPSSIYFIRSQENALVKGLPFSFLSLILGWWGIPWGPIYTIQSLGKNFSGGKDVTSQVMASLVACQPTDNIEQVLAG